ncbi:YgiQ family radical SAM protein [Eubacteriaceae bacterium RF-744-FAT-4]|uniref:YgiQ family radical SAM protein n=2 Tax=Pseudoramibacter porci TaxID=2606631 RepID=A0A7X2NFE8_9FIRM|nr:YgiQ family radical SAM protein [Pseudoramibacter porci]
MNASKIAIDAKMPFPRNKREMQALQWECCDFILVSGDAFVDHSSFGPTIIARVLTDLGYHVGVIAQPKWDSSDAFQVLGQPRLAFLVSSGNMDSMVCHYTVNKKRRHDDAYTPGGKTGARPDRAVITYCGRIREAWGSVPIVVGGVEASLRRFAHYDYWQNRVRRPILFDSGADLLVYGMGEKAIAEIAEALDAGLPIDQITYIRGTGVMARELPDDAVVLPSFEKVSEPTREGKRAFAEMTNLIEKSANPFKAHPTVQPCGGRYFVQNPPQLPLTTQEMDDVYELPYTNQQLGGGPEITGMSEMHFSITSNRGCFGSCAFCAIGMHQGRIVSSRSRASILNEAKRMTQDPRFKGIINDVGGPTANFLHPACAKQLKTGPCANRECLFPEVCPNIDADQSEFAEMLQALRQLPGVRKVFVRSGIRYDYLMADPTRAAFNELVCHHVSGQLRVAPEHLSDRVLHYMGKPKFKQYDQFVQKFNRASEKHHLKQYVVPYFISSHPGSTLQDAVVLAEYLRDHHLEPEQVQDFYPTPGSRATAMYYTGLDLESFQPIHIPKGREKRLQRALLQYRNPKNRSLVIEALKRCGREDLIGSGRKCLIHPQNQRPKQHKRSRRNRKGGK